MYDLGLQPAERARIVCWERVAIRRLPPTLKPWPDPTLQVMHAHCHRHHHRHRHRHCIATVPHTRVHARKCVCSQVLHAAASEFQHVLFVKAAALLERPAQLQPAREALHSNGWLCPFEPPPTAACLCVAWHVPATCLRPCDAAH